MLAVQSVGLVCRHRIMKIVLGVRISPRRSYNAGAVNAQKLGRQWDELEQLSCKMLIVLAYWQDTYSHLGGLSLFYLFATKVNVWSILVLTTLCDFMTCLDLLFVLILFTQLITFSRPHRCRAFHHAYHWPSWPVEICLSTFIAK